MFFSQTSPVLGERAVSVDPVERAGKEGGPVRLIGEPMLQICPREQILLSSLLVRRNRARRARKEIEALKDQKGMMGFKLHFV
jgi:hypothetical protein